MHRILGGSIMTESTVVIRVDEDLKSAFAIAAKAADRTASQLVRDFMRDYVQNQVERTAYDQWFRASVEEARAEVRAGKLAPGDEVEAHFRAMREHAAKRLAD
jgi:predicted transcriptional regulator